MGESNREREGGRAQGHSRERATTKLVKSDLQSGDCRLSLRTLFGVFTKTPTAGDQPGTGAGSAPAGGGNAGGEGALGFATGGGRCR